MLTSPLAPYLLWAKSRAPVAIDLAGSNLLHCTMDDLPGARESVDLPTPGEHGPTPLVTAIAADYGVTPDRVATAGGCSGANFLTIAALVGPGDHVLIEQPAYDPLIGACRLMGATVHRFVRRFEDGFQLDPDPVRAALTPRTRLVIISNPHNPSGAILDGRGLAALADIAARAGVTVLVDEVYLDGSRLIAAGGARLPAAATLDGPFVSTNSLTKSYGLAGLRCGWAVAAPALAERIRRTRDVVDNASSGPSDRLATLAFARIAALRERTRALLSTNVARAARCVAECPDLEVAMPPASSIVFPRLAASADAGPFVDRLARDAGVAVVPGRFFDAPGHFRISLGGRPEVVDDGLTRIAAALGSVRPGWRS